MEVRWELGLGSAWELGVVELGVDMLVIRMRRVGTTKKPYFRVVVTEAKTARESSFVENVGTYNPRSKPAKVEINKERLQHWLKRGAQPSDSVRTLIAKHLSRDLSAPVVAAQTPTA
jgi:small subunit ribosomal protein S16